MLGLPGFILVTPAPVATLFAAGLSAVGYHFFDVFPLTSDHLLQVGQRTGTNHCHPLQLTFLLLLHIPNSFFCFSGHSPKLPNSLLTLPLLLFGAPFSLKSFSRHFADILMNPLAPTPISNSNTSTSLHSSYISSSHGTVSSTRNTAFIAVPNSTLPGHGGVLQNFPRNYRCLRRSTSIMNPGVYLRCYHWAPRNTITI